jgi:hypothetical protein
METLGELEVQNPHVGGFERTLEKEKIPHGKGKLPTKSQLRA